MNDLPLRVVSAAVLIAATTYLLGYAPVWLFIAVHTAVLAVMTWEVVSILSRKHNLTGRLLPVAAAVSWNLLEGLPHLEGPVCTLIFILIFAYAMSLDRDLPYRFQTMALLLFATIYPAVLWRPMLGMERLEKGPLVIGYLLVVNFSTDIGAYFGGKMFGRHALAPRLSPKKTWEGLLSGLLLAVLVSLVAIPAVAPIRWVAVPLGIAIALLGQLSDLAESLLKRACDVKDSGGIIPGHGGLLDRCDSLLFNIPLVYYCWLFFWK